VQRIGLRLAAASQDPEVLRILHMKPQKFNWEFRVIASRQVNAFCLPGGKVVVYTAILPVCKDEDGLATVMGHEIGHALAHHGAERIARKQLEEIGQMGVAASLNNMRPEKRAALMVALGAAVQYGESLPFNREQESEADHIGLLLMAAAGYDPRSAVPFWQRMAQLGGSRPPEFMSTHPGPEHRAEALAGWMNQALDLYRHSDRQDGTRLLPRP
jgi:predicted Zn-dependent protease